MAAQNPVEATTKFFTVEEANRSLPLVKAIVGDIVRQFEVVNSRKQSLIALKNLRRRPGAPIDAYAEETSRSQADLEAEEVHLDAYITELTRLGVRLKGFDGLCDFPSLRDGREVHLCWRLEEPSVRYWHEVNAGYAGRQPLEPVAQAEKRRS